MANPTKAQVNTLIGFWNIRGQQIANLAQSSLTLVQGSPVDLSSVLSPVTVLAEAYAKVQTTLIAWIIENSVFSTFPLNGQLQLMAAITYWQDLTTFLGSFALRNSYPLLDSITQASPAAQLFGATTANPSSINVALESILSVPTMSGLSIATFWSYSQSSIAILSTLLSIDLAMNNNPTAYNYTDVPAALNAGLSLLTSMAPQQIDSAAILNQISNNVATGLSFSAPTVISTIIIPENATVQDIALMYLGDANQWENIVTLNNLVFPYITDDPILQLGQNVGQGTLTSTASSGASTITVSGLTYLYAGQRVLLQSGSQYQILNITGGSFPPLGIQSTATSFTLNVTPNLASTFPSATTVVSIYPPTGDAGNILGSGATLLLPGANTTSTVTNKNTTAVSDDPLYFGTDIAISANGTLSLNTLGDLAVVAGLPNMNQALRNRFNTAAGSLDFHPNYGNSLETFIGLSNNGNTGFLAQISSVQTALTDPRVTRVSNSTAIVANDNVTIDLTLVLNNGKLFSPSRITVPISLS